MANRIAEIQTNMGTIRLELFEDKAPVTTKNFIDLAEKGFYDGVIFHPVIDGFMIQGADPTAPGRGTLSMANAGPNTGGSQFFITLAATPWLDNRHAVFGKVIEGMDVVEKIGKVRTGPGDRPIHDVTMEKVTIREA
mgnify:CR=1 FL=1